MAKTAWPTTAELNTALTAASLTLPAWITAQEVIDLAVKRWEQATGYSPWLAEAVDSTSIYSPTGSDIITLRNPYVSMTSVTIDETLLDATFWDIGPDGGEPYDYLDLGCVTLGSPTTVTLVGRKGWSATIPIDVWIAVFQESLDIAKEYIASASGAGESDGNIKKIKQASVEIEYFSKESRNFSTGMISRYRRWL